MMYLPIAIELANERVRDAERSARASRWSHELDLLTLAAISGRAAPYGDPADPRRPQRPGRARRLIARPIRAFSSASHALSDAACTAATRIEGTAR